jgi:DNA-directed RNA polymerase specialized sigma24 family protein
MSLSDATTDARFDEFAAEARPRLVRAFVAIRGVDGAQDAAAEALAWGFEHWDRVRVMDNPVGYLYRVGQSRTRPRRQPPALPAPSALGVPEVEPGLIAALAELPGTQRTAVWLIHACQWTYAEVAAAMDTSTSMVGNHVSRALTKLRHALEVDTDA